MRFSCTNVCACDGASEGIGTDQLGFDLFVLGLVPIYLVGLWPSSGFSVLCRFESPV